jgi:hypothetical protein
MYDFVDRLDYLTPCAHLCRPHPRSRVLARILDDVFRVNTRLQPFLERYQQVLREDTVFTRGVSTLLFI